MIMVNGGIVMLAALNLAFSIAVGLLLLLHCPHVVWPMPIRRPDCWREKPDLKTEGKGDKFDEQNLG